ncbi:MAG: ATP synthase F1 subunit epsilon [Alphaproteobacteria bacterium]|nr:ATP synthase F1 subunit epsilon [Alphaproteobacteria bacterium]
MASTLHVEIVTPTEVVFKGEVTEVRAPGFLGEFGVLPGHAPFLSVVRPGVVRMHTSEGAVSYVVGKGFVEAGPARVVVLVQSTQLASNVDKGAASHELQEAEKALLTLTPGSAEHAVQENRADMARARLSV